MRWLAGENLNKDIVRGLLRRKPVSPAWTMRHYWLGQRPEHRVLLTHDVSTMTAYAYRQVARGDTCLASLK
ncbi:MAG: hypothetical protein ABSH50_16810 [Bryobacteraceae bacterium]